MGGSKTNPKGGKKSRKETLVRELQGLLKDVDEDGLAFLVNQARILLYNTEVDRMNRELQQKRTKLEADLTGKKARPGVREKISVSIEEAANKSHFIVSLGNCRKFFVLEEFRGLVKVCQAARNAREAAENLYRWLKRNRGDVLADAAIGSGKNPLLGDLYGAIIGSYRARQ